MNEIAPEIINAITTLITFICISWAFLYVITKHRKIINFMTTRVHPKKILILMILIGGFVDILASEFSFLLFGASANIRDCVIIFSAIVGGPFAGIGVGLIGGCYRITGLRWSGFMGNMGYISALGCGLAAVGAGFVGAWLSKYKNVNVMGLNGKKICFVIMIMAVWEVVHSLVINPPLMPLFSALTFKESFFFAGEKMLLPMILGNCFGIFVFLLIAIDTVKNKKIMETKRIREKLELSEKLIKRYEEYIGPVAKTIAKDIAEEEEK
jgi:LytS/YehU family sensor histidine kinase